MNKTLFSLIIGLTTSAFSYAADVVPNDDVRLLVVNGIKMETSTDSATVDPGFTQVLVRMTKTVGKGSNKRVFDSRPFVLQFTSPDSDVEIVGPAIYSYEQATNHFKKNPDWKVLSGNRELDVTIEQLPPKAGMMPYFELEEMMAEYNKGKGIVFGANAKLVADTKMITNAPVESQVNAAAVATEPTKSAVMESTANLDQLKGWYIKASKAERKEFRRWMIDQE